MSIFNYLGYREFLDFEIKRRKRSLPGFTQASLAKAAGIRTSYLTNVLKGRGNFNSDQIDALAQQLKLRPEETYYLFLLKEYDQSTMPARKISIWREIERLQEASKKTESHISVKVRTENQNLITKYYGDPLIKIVHVLLQVPKYAGEPTKIAEDLNISSRYLQKVLDVLQELSIISFKDKVIEVLEKNFHLPKESPMLLPHQTLVRLKSTQRLQEVEIDKRYSFSVTFTGTEETRSDIQKKFLEFIQGIEKTVKKAPAENAYQLNFDLFPWNDY